MVRYLSTALVCCWLVGGARDRVARRVGGRDPCADVLRWRCLCSTSTTPTRCGRSTAGGSAIGAPVPMHPSFEDREGAPDVLLAAVPADLVEHLSSVWEGPFRAAGADRADVFHLHHLTPQHDAVRRCWPEGAVVAHLHGTELKFLEAVNERVALGQVGGNDAGRHARLGTGQPGAGVPARRFAARVAANHPLGAMGRTARRGAIGSAARLTPPTIWWSCHPLTGQRPSSCSGSMPSGSRTFPTGWT